MQQTVSMANCVSPRGDRHRARRTATSRATQPGRSRCDGMRPMCGSQGICAEAMLRAITLIYNRLRQAGTPGGLVANVHDELLCLEVVEDDAEAARQLLAQTMIDAFVETFPGAPITGVAEVSVGSNWAVVKEGAKG